MKKYAALLLTIVTVISLVACSSDNNDRNQDSGSDGSSVLSSLRDNISTEAPDTSSTDDTSSTVYTGEIGDTMSTAWFDFTINSAEAYNDYAGYTAAPNRQLVVVDITIYNTFSSSNPMVDTDFWITWDDTGRYADPVASSESISSEFLPGEYDMDPGDEVTGKLLYEVPATFTSFAVNFTEYFASNEFGDSFAVYFTPEEVQSIDHSGGIIYGEIGDAMRTWWFDFTVEAAGLLDEYEEYTPDEGNKLLVVYITLENTFSEAVPMYHYDFDVEWDEPDAYAYPIAMYVDGDVFPEEEESYEIPYEGSTDLAMVFEVPEEFDEFIIYFDEYFANDVLGDMFGVYFELQ